MRKEGEEKMYRRKKRKARDKSQLCVCECAHVCVCMCVCMCVYVHVCVHVCVCMCVCVCVLYFSCSVQGRSWRRWYSGRARLMKVSVEWSLASDAGMGLGV